MIVLASPSSAGTTSDRWKKLRNGIQSVVTLQRTTIDALVSSPPYNGLCTNSAGNERFMRRAFTDLRQHVGQTVMSKSERSKAMRFIAEGEARMPVIEHLLEKRLCRLQA
jgi:hypothetical protein